MILIDSREKTRPHPHDPSRTVGVNMAKLFSEHHAQPTNETRLLLAGDFSFTGNGPDGPVMVGVERKRLRDFLSSIQSGRLAGEQLVKLHNYYEYVYLVVEGQFRTNRHTGTLEEKWGKGYKPVSSGKREHSGQEVESAMNTFSTLGGVTVRRTRNEYETVDYVVSLQKWFSKPWDKHTSHLAVHIPTSGRVSFTKASHVRRIAMAIEGLGYDKSLTVERFFPTVESMVMATSKEWQGLPGFGPKLAARIMEQLHGKGE